MNAFLPRPAYDTCSSLVIHHQATSQRRGDGGVGRYTVVCKWKKVDRPVCRDTYSFSSHPILPEVSIGFKRN